MNNVLPRICLLFILVAGCGAGLAQADEYDDIVKPLFTQTCEKCHGEGEANAEIRFDQFPSSATFLSQPKLIQRTLEAIDTGAMPPEGEPGLDEATRLKAVAALKRLLREASLAAPKARPQLQRLHRFQYNNTVRDLIQLNRNLFALPEKLMTRYDDSLSHGPMPDTVQVASQALNPQPGQQDVKPFPKDLPAEHGFDNQTNQLTLSP